MLRSSREGTEGLERVECYALAQIVCVEVLKTPSKREFWVWRNDTRSRSGPYKRLTEARGNARRTFEQVVRTERSRAITVLSQTGLLYAGGEHMNVDLAWEKLDGKS